MFCSSSVIAGAAWVRVSCDLFLYVRDHAARALPEFKTRAEIGQASDSRPAIVIAVSSFSASNSSRAAMRWAAFRKYNLSYIYELAVLCSVVINLRYR